MSTQGRGRPCVTLDWGDVLVNVSNGCRLERWVRLGNTPKNYGDDGLEVKVWKKDRHDVKKCISK